jgi:uncharacterized protein
MDSQWEQYFERLLKSHMDGDAAHDLQHIRRVVTNARRLCLAEKADELVVLPAAWLHDCLTVPKSSPDRIRASRMAAEQAVIWLEENHWPHDNLQAIAHAIEAHSFSAGIPARTLEAKVVQDADRLDALGAIGLARTLMLGATLQRELYHPEDPFATSRAADDSIYTIDHLYCKLLTLESTMQTATGREEARQRTVYLRDFLTQLQLEISNDSVGREFT